MKQVGDPWSILCRSGVLFFILAMVSAPGWAEVTLAKPAIVHRVLVQPFGERLGVRAFYMKIVTPEGIELDTYPPAEIERPPVKAPGTGIKPLPMVLDFEPVHAQRLKFYFTQPGFGSGLMYIEDIRVFGIEADEVSTPDTDSQ